MVRHPNRMTPEEKARLREFFQLMNEIAEKGTKTHRKVLKEANQGMKKTQ